MTELTTCVCHWNTHTDVRCCHHQRVCVCVCLCVWRWSQVCVSPPYDILGNTKPAVTMETLTDLLTLKAETEGVCVCVLVQSGWLSVCVCVCGRYIDFMTNTFAVYKNSFIPFAETFDTKCSQNFLINKRFMMRKNLTRWLLLILGLQDVSEVTASVHRSWVFETWPLASIHMPGPWLQPWGVSGNCLFSVLGTKINPNIPRGSAGRNGSGIDFHRAIITSILVFY